MRQRGPRYPFLGEWIRYRGETQSSVAEGLGMSPHTVSRWVSMERGPEPPVVVRLCEFLRVDENQLLHENPYPNGDGTRRDDDEKRRSVARSSNQTLGERSAEPGRDVSDRRGSYSDSPEDPYRKFPIARNEAEPLQGRLRYSGKEHGQEEESYAQTPRSVGEDALAQTFELVHERLARMQDGQNRVVEQQQVLMDNFDARGELLVRINENITVNTEAVRMLVDTLQKLELAIYRDQARRNVG